MAKEKETRKITIELPEEVVAWLDTLAIDEGRSRNGQVVYLLRMAQRQQLAAAGYTPSA